jgi:oligoribonuclease
MRFLWLDLETTGLDPDKDLVLEIAWQLTASNDPFHFSTAGPETEVIHHEGEIVGRHLSEATWRMHGKSGLLAEVAAATKTLDEVEDQILEVVRDRAFAEEPVHLAGSSIFFDKSFLKVHMPRLHARLHYRVLDVTSFYLVAQHYGLLSAQKKVVSTHRAVDDVKGSVRHLREILNEMSPIPSPGPTQLTLF